jgi:hypothetical protein
LIADCTLLLVIDKSLFRYPQVFTAVSLTFRALFWLSPCVGAILIVREVLGGRSGNILWPAVLTILTGGVIALLLLGGLIVMPD